jgi:hypothetical protein
MVWADTPTALTKNVTPGRPPAVRQRPTGTPPVVLRCLWIACVRLSAGWPMTVKFTSEAQQQSMCSSFSQGDLPESGIGPYLLNVLYKLCARPGFCWGLLCRECRELTEFYPWSVPARIPVPTLTLLFQNRLGQAAQLKIQLIIHQKLQKP